MASVGNKINKLVSTPDNDLTAELEIPAFFADERERDDQDPEADANTLEIKISGLEADPDEASNGALKPGTHPRADSLDRLQVDIDQLRAKWTGLEQEIETRQKITDNLNA